MTRKEVSLLVKHPYRPRCGRYALTSMPIGQAAAWGTDAKRWSTALSGFDSGHRSAWMPDWSYFSDHPTADSDYINFES